MIALVVSIHTNMSMSTLNRTQVQTVTFPKHGLFIVTKTITRLDNKTRTLKHHYVAFSTFIIFFQNP